MATEQCNLRIYCGKIGTWGEFKEKETPFSSVIAYGTITWCSAASWVRSTRGLLLKST